MARVNTVKKAQKDYPRFGIKKGDTYYWWKFNFGPEIKSKTYPSRSQLTRSGFLSELYELEDSLEPDRENLADWVSDTVSRIQELLDQCQESLDNMPEALQESSDSGNTLQERIDALESWIGDLESVDTDVPDVDDIELDDEERAEALKDVDPDNEDEVAKAIQEAMEAKREERIEEIVDELVGLGSGL